MNSSQFGCVERAAGCTWSYNPTQFQGGSVTIRIHGVEGDKWCLFCCQKENFYPRIHVVCKTVKDQLAKKNLQAYATGGKIFQ